MSSSEEFPGFDQFYLVSEGQDGAAFRAAFDPPLDVFRLVRAELDDTEVVSLRWRSGRYKPGDVVFTASACAIIIHERVVRVLADGGFSGWRTYDVMLRDRAGSEVPGYSALACTGRVGPMVESMCIPMQSVFPGGRSTVWTGTFFDPATWDGSDVFALSKSGYIVFRDVVVERMREAVVRNLRYTRLDETQHLMLLGRDDGDEGGGA